MAEVDIDFKRLGGFAAWLQALKRDAEQARKTGITLPAETGAITTQGYVCLSPSKIEYIIAALERAERLEKVLGVIAVHPQAASVVVGIARAALEPK